MEFMADAVKRRERNAHPDLDDPWSSGITPSLIQADYERQLAEAMNAYASYVRTQPIALIEPQSVAPTATTIRGVVNRFRERVRRADV